MIVFRLSTVENQINPFPNNKFKGDHSDFSHLAELKNLYITEIYMKKQCKSSIIKNHKITPKKNFDGVPLKGYVASEVIFRFCARNKKTSIVGISSETDDA